MMRDQNLTNGITNIKTDKYEDPRFVHKSAVGTNRVSRRQI